MRDENVTRRDVLATLTAALCAMPFQRCSGNAGRQCATEPQGIDDGSAVGHPMVFDFHLKSFDPRYRPFLITITRAEYCWDQRYSEELLEETDPCLFRIHCDDEADAEWLKSHIETARMFEWLYYTPHINPHPSWTRQSWPPLPKGQRCCRVELRRIPWSERNS